MEHIEIMTNIAKKQSRAIVESGEECIPIVFALSPKGISIIGILEINKNLFKPAVAELLRQLHAYAYIFVCEAWVTNLIPNSPLFSKLQRGEISVSELPLDDKIKILTITVVENKKSFHCWLAKIRYTPDDKRYLDKWEMIEEKSNESAEGRLVLKEW